ANSQRPLPQSAAQRCAMVSHASACSPCAATTSARFEAPGTLGLLWPYRQLQPAVELLLPGHPIVEAMAVAPLRQGAPRLGENAATSGALPAPQAVRCSTKSRSEPVTRGAGCGKSARPDLRGTPVGNHRGLPNREPRIESPVGAERCPDYSARCPPPGAQHVVASPSSCKVRR